MIRVMVLHTKEVTRSSHEMRISHGEKQSTVPSEPMHLACVHSTEDPKNFVHLVLAIDWYGLFYARLVELVVSAFRRIVLPARCCRLFLP